MKKDLPKFQSIFSRFVWLCIISFCFLTACVRVQPAQQLDPNNHFILVSDGEAIDPSTTETKNKKMQNQTWEPPPPPPDEFDWIQLNSGEWLKGELKRLYDRKLEFDSDKLKLLEFDWKDVKQVRGPRIFGVRFVGQIEVVGSLQVTENKVIVTKGDEQQVFKRDQLVAIAAGGEKEIDSWAGKVSIGFNVSEGNTEEMQYSAMTTIKRRTAATRLGIDYLGNITKTNRIETVNNHRIKGYFDVFKTHRSYYRPGFVEVYRDPFTNIKYRLTLGFGMGYNLIDTPKTEWRVTGGPAYQTTKFDSVEPGEGSSEWTPALVAGTSFDTELTKTIDFVFKYNFQILNKDSGSFTHHSVTALETELTDWLDFDTSFVWDRIKNPTPDSDGLIPEKDDFYLIFSLGINF